MVALLSGNETFAVLICISGGIWTRSPSRPALARYSTATMHRSRSRRWHAGGAYDRLAAFARQWKAGQTELGNSAS